MITEDQTDFLLRVARSLTESRFTADEAKFLRRALHSYRGEPYDNEKDYPVLSSIIHKIVTKERELDV